MEGVKFFLSLRDSIIFRFSLTGFLNLDLQNLNRVKIIFDLKAPAKLEVS